MIRGQLLGTVEEQRRAHERYAGRPRQPVVDPASVPDLEGVPVLYEFRIDQVIGLGRTYHVEGRVMVEMELDVEAPMTGVVGQILSLSKEPMAFVPAVVNSQPPSVYAIGLTAMPLDPDSPHAEVVR
jgi:hypothetical protein